MLYMVTPGLCHQEQAVKMQQSMRSFFVAKPGADSLHAISKVLGSSLYPAGYDPALLPWMMDT